MTRFQTALLFDGSTVTAHDKITHLYPKTLLYFLNVYWRSLAVINVKVILLE